MPDPAPRRATPVQARARQTSPDRVSSKRPAASAGHSEQEPSRAQQVHRIGIRRACAGRFRDRARHPGHGRQDRRPGQDRRALLLRRRLLRTRRNRAGRRHHRAALQDEPDQRHPEVARAAGPRWRPRHDDYVSVAGSALEDPAELPGRHHVESLARRPAQPAARRESHGAGAGRKTQRHDPRRRSPRGNRSRPANPSTCRC